MRHEHTVKYPCPDCGCPIVQVATYCCSDEADLICNGCKTTKTIPADEAREIYDTHDYAVRLWGAGGIVCYRPTPVPLEKRKPDVIYMADIEPLSEVETQEFIALMEQYEYVPKGAQIGFLGKEQVFNPPIEL